jgi:multicomponent Na+:H+ antiporter subunit E
VTGPPTGANPAAAPATGALATDRETAPRRAARGWRQHWRAHLMTVVVLLAVWLALWGSASLPLVAAGLLLAVLVLVLFPLPPIEFSFGLHPWRAAVLAGRFALDVAAASAQVAYLAFRRRPPATDIVTVVLASDSDLIQHLTALAVSLVPGSLIVDADPDERTLTIHVLYPSPRPPERFTAEVLAQEARIRAALGGGEDARGAPDPAPDRAEEAGPS